MARGVQGRLRTLTEELPPALRPAWQDLCERRRWLDDDAPDYLIAVGSQPILGLPCWVAESLGVDDQALLDVARSAWLGYASIRVVDDWLDDGILADEPHTALFLARQLGFEHSGPLLRLAPALQPRLREAWRHEADGMLAERAWLASGHRWTEADYLRSLGRAEPLSLPGEALLHHVGRPDLVSAMQGCARALAHSAQLWNDLLDVGSDAAQGRCGYVGQRLGADLGPAAFANRFLREGAADAVFVESAAWLDRAISEARPIGLAGLDGWVHRRKAFMGNGLRAGVEAMLTALLGAA